MSFFLLLICVPFSSVSVGKCRVFSVLHAILVGSSRRSRCGSSSGLRRKKLGVRNSVKVALIFVRWNLEFKVLRCSNIKSGSKATA